MSVCVCACVCAFHLVKSLVLLINRVMYTITFIAYDLLLGLSSVL